MRDVGLQALYIAPRPVLIMYSLEKRFKLLSQNGLLDVELDHYTTALLAKKFLHKLVDSYKDIVPGHADDYASACLGKPPKGDDRP